MSEIVFDSADLYIESTTDLRSKITRLNQVIDALISASIKGAANANMEEYSLDDGQTKIRAKYKDMAQIQAAINAFEKAKQIYVNRLNGRSFMLVDGKSFL